MPASIVCSQCGIRYSDALEACPWCSRLPATDGAAPAGAQPATPTPGADHERAPSPTAERRYDAFISYSHAVDGPLAAELRKALQRFAKPWNRRRALRVFLDSDSLEATASLGDALEDRLAGTRYLIMLASKESARSAWCDREAAYWVQHRGSDSLLLVLTDADGGLAWDDEAGAFDPDRSQSLPPSLVRAFPEEPLWVDLSWVEGEGANASLDLRNPRFRGAVASLAAPIHGLPKDALDGEDLRQHRTFTRVRRAAVAGLAVLLMGAVAASIVAVVQAGIARDNEAEALRQEGIARENEAEALRQEGIARENEAEALRQESIARENEAEARENARVSVLRQVAAAARAELDVQLDTALLLAVEAYELVTDDDIETGVADVAHEALLAAVLRQPEIVRFLRLGDAAITGLAVAADGNVYASDAAGTVKVWPSTEGEQRLLSEGLGSVRDLVLTSSGQVAVVIDRSVIVLDTDDGAIIDQVEFPLGEFDAVGSMVPLPDDSLVISTTEGVAWRWAPGTGAPPDRVFSTELSFDWPSLSVSPDGSQLVAITNNESVVFDLTTSPWNDRTIVLALFDGPTDFVHLSDDRLIGVASDPDGGSAVVEIDLSRELVGVVAPGGSQWSEAVALDDHHFAAAGANPSLIVGEPSCFDGSCVFLGEQYSLPNGIRDLDVARLARGSRPDTILLGGGEGSIIEWSIPGAVLEPPAEPTSVTAPDADALARLEEVVGAPVSVEGLGQSRGASLSPSGAMAVVAVDSGVIVLDRQTGAATRLIGLEQSSPTYGWAFSPDERLLFVVGAAEPQPEGLSYGINLIAYDVESGRPYGEPLRLAADIDRRLMRAIGDRSGSKLVLEFEDGTAASMALTPDVWARHACTVANRALTEEEWTRLIGDVIAYDPSCVDGELVADG